MKEERLPLDCRLTRQNTEFLPTLEEVRILFVVDGRCRVVRNADVLTLGKSDYLLINVLEEASVYLETDSHLAILSLPYYELLRASDRISVRFDLCSLNGKSGKYVQMTSMLQGMVMCFVGDIHAERLKAMGLYYILLQNLITDFSLIPQMGLPDKGREEKINEIMQYLWANYSGEITMTEIAEKVYLSRSVASRLFKAATGENFPDYLKKLRLSSVKRALERTDLSVTQIALENGFSSPSALNRTFRESFGISPGEYRKNHRTQNALTKEEESDRRKVLEILRTDLELQRTGSEEIHTEIIDTGNSISWEPWKNRLLNVGTFSSLLSARMQQQIAFLIDRLNLEYLRIWNPFSREMMILGEDKNRYNYTLLDEVLDFCVDHHVKVFIDLTPRRERNMANETREIHATSSPNYFNTSEEWLHAIHSFVSHLKNRYQEKVVNDWILELTFSLNDIPYYANKEYSASAAWNQAFKVIKGVIPGIRLAAPGYIMRQETETNEEEIREFLSLCEHQPDVFTSIHFPYYMNGREFYQQTMIKDPSRYFFSQQVGRIRDILQNCGFAGEHFITECGISIANRNYLQDSCFRGAAMLEEMLENRSKADSIGVFYGSDLIGAYSDSSAVVCGSGGLLAGNGIRKPVYYAYRFLRQLGDRKLLLSDNCAASSFHSDDIRIVCWNRKNLGPRYYVNEEDSFRPEEIEQMMENLDPYFLELKIEGLDSGQRYRIRQRIMNEETGGVLLKWRKLGVPTVLSRDDQEYLYQTCIPEVISEDKTAENGGLHIALRLMANEIRMIQITKE